MSFWTEAPPPEELLQMEPEEIAPFVLRYLQQQPADSINRYNFSLLNDPVLTQRLGLNKVKDYMKCVMEAWMWLEREGFIAPQPGQEENWAFITRKGKRVLEASDFDAYKKGYLFPANLDPVLIRYVRPLFVRGDYETAVFRAFKEVEVRVRKMGNFTNEDIGVDLMKKAFGPTGPLANQSITKGEKERVRELFVGAIGTFKNPLSHRDVQFSDPSEVIDVICLANQLLRIVDRSSAATAK